MQAHASDSQARLFTASTRFSAAAAAVTAVTGAAVLVGWLFNISWLKSLVPGLATMKPLTALALLLAGIALWQARKVPVTAGGRVDWRRRLARIGAGIVAALGAMVLFEYLTGLSLGIDQLLFQQAVRAEAALPAGRPTPASALSLLLLGLALLALDSKAEWFAQVAALIALLFSALALLGYAYGVTALYQVGTFVSIALHTALTLALLLLGLLAARPRGPISGPLTSDLAGGVVSRRLLPAIFIVPFVLGWLRLYGQALGQYDTTFGVALLVISNIIIFAALAYANARWLNQSDANRLAAHAALTQNEENLRLMLDGIKDHAIFMLDAAARRQRSAPRPNS